VLFLKLRTRSIGDFTISYTLKCKSILESCVLHYKNSVLHCKTEHESFLVVQNTNVSKTGMDIQYFIPCLLHSLAVSPECVAKRLNPGLKHLHASVCQQAPPSDLFFLLVVYLDNCC